MVTEKVREIKTAEEKASEILKSAEKKASEIDASLADKLSALRAEKEKDLKKSLEEYTAASTKAIQGKIKEMEGGYGRRLEDIKKTAGSSVEKAAEAVWRQLKSSI